MLHVAVLVLRNLKENTIGIMDYGTLYYNLQFLSAIKSRFIILKKMRHLFYNFYTIFKATNEPMLHNVPTPFQNGALFNCQYA